MNTRLSMICYINLDDICSENTSEEWSSARPWLNIDLVEVVARGRRGSWGPKLTVRDVRLQLQR